MLMAELDCLLPWVDGWVTPAWELSDAGVSLTIQKLGWCRCEQFEQPRLESQFLAMWKRLRQMKQRPCFFVCPFFHWFVPLLTKGTCNRLSHWSQQCIEGWRRGLGWVFSSLGLQRKLLPLSYTFLGLPLLFWILKAIHPCSNFLCQTPC